MDAPDLFKTAPREVTRYFDGKANVPSFDWRDIAPAEHAFSFTVAKSAGYDILDDIRAAVADAITNRVPFEEFRARLTPILQAKGWWGKKEAADPATGELRAVQLGSPRRLQTIYWANTATAHAAGEWERTQRNKRFLPFLIYLRSVAEHKRLEHLRYVGTVAPVDDPIWDWLYPPNGWGCKCGVRQVSRQQALDLGWNGEEPPQPAERPWRNKRTGETVMVPEGVDPGWDTNPGKHRAANVSRFLTDRIETMPAPRQRIAIEDIVSSPVLKAFAEGRLKQGFVPVAQLPARIVEAMGAETPVVRLSADSVAHILTEHSARGLSVDEFRAAISVLTAPTAAMREEGSRSVRLVGAALGTWWRVVVKSAAEGKEWWLTSFHRKSEAETLKAIERARRSGSLME